MAETEVKQTPDVTDPNTTPPLPKATMLGLQHVFANFAGTITVPIIIAGVIAAETADKAYFINIALFAAGLATLIQTIGIGPVGSRLPVMQGTSFGFIPILIPLVKTAGIKAVLGGALVCGLVQVILAAGLRKFRNLIPPLVSGIVVTTIGISLMIVAVKYAGGGVWLHDNKPEFFAGGKHIFLAVLVLVLTIGINQYLRGFLASSAVLIAMIIGYLIAIPMGMVNFDGIGDSSWVAIPQPFAYGLSFPVIAIIGMTLMAVVTTIETIGDISATTIGGANREATDKELSGGIYADGAGTALAAVFGALPNTSYSQNVGLVAFSGVMSRHVVTIAGGVMVVLGLFPKVGAVIGAMPYAVLGGAAIVMFGLIASAGIKLIARHEMNRRNMLVIAVSLTAGIALPLVPEFSSKLPGDLQVLINSGIVPAALLALIMNAILPKSPEQKPAVEGQSAAA